MIFRQPMLSTEVSLAIGAPKRKRLFGAAILALHRYSLANTVRLHKVVI